MKVAIIGYNIFDIGGTTRSNLNLIHELSNAVDIQSTYYNFSEFSPFDVLSLNLDYPYTQSTSFNNISDLFEKKDGQNQDVYIITRESFFPLAQFLRSKNPKSIIVGEIHAPLQFLDPSFSKNLDYFSYIRVSTKSIKEEFLEKFHFERVFVQKVSILHVLSEKKEEAIETNNFLILSRFDDSTKDISYTLKLFDFLVNQLKKEYHLYLVGNGSSELLYKNLIKYYKLSKYVHLNNGKPQNYIYLSTSRLETYGYSIIEALGKGHRIACYPGDDMVMKENFGELSCIDWLTKDIISDAKTLCKATNKLVSENDYDKNLKLLKDQNDNYATRFFSAISQPIIFENEFLQELTSLQVQQIRVLITDKTIKSNYAKYRDIYLKLKNAPLIGKIVSNKKTRTLSKKMINYIETRKDMEEDLHENYFFFESFHGQNFSGDPKYIALEISKTVPGAKIFVSSANQLVDIEIRSFGFIALRISSKRYFSYFSQCKYIFVNGNSLDSAGRKRDQIFIQTWHGFPIKKMVADIEDKKQKKLELRKFIPRMKKWDYLVSSSPFHTELLSSAFNLKENRKLKILELGTPKNGFLIKNKENRELKRKLLFKYFNSPIYLQEDKKYILFCPTWRKEKRNGVTKIDLKLLIQSLPEYYEIIVKLHPNEGSLRKKYSQIDPRIHCFYNELVDIQELYLCCDLLISDYSSAIFDFAHLSKRIIVLQEDMERYKNSIGMYFDSEKLLNLKANDYSTKGLVEEILKEKVDDSYNNLIVEKLLNKDNQESGANILKQIGII